MPSGVELTKWRLALAARFEEGNAEALYSQAQHLLDLAVALTQRGQELDNYEVLGYDGGTKTWTHMEKGTKEYCIGWATGIKAMKANWPHLCVVCGSFVVWPESLWGADATISPEEQERD